MHSTRRLLIGVVLFLFTAVLVVGSTSSESRKDRPEQQPRIGRLHDSSLSGLIHGVRDKQHEQVPKNRKKEKLKQKEDKKYKKLVT
jgi:hypothetical protein